MVRTLLKGVYVVALLVVVSGVTACGSKKSSGSSATPTAIEGIETPSSVSVVSANNAD
jgi:hypothetical protein